MRRILTYACEAALILAILYALCLLFATQGGRSYFSPDTLEWKSRSELFLARTGTRLYAFEYRTYRNSLVEYLILKGHWSPIDVKRPRWLLTSDWNGRGGGPSSLHRELSWRKYDWIRWSEEHPNLAAVMWPRVLAVIRDTEVGAQSSATAILSFARIARSVEKFDRLAAYVEDSL